MQTACLAFSIAATGPDLTVTVVMDNEVIWQGQPGPVPTDISYDIDDSQEGEHCLQIKLDGKLPEHTVLDHTGSIQQDRVIEISNFRLDDIELGHALTENTVYCHDHNGQGDSASEPFYGIMGCNGDVTLRFSTPVYSWLLQIM